MHFSVRHKTDKYSYEEEIKPGRISPCPLNSSTPNNNDTLSSKLVIISRMTACTHYLQYTTYSAHSTVQYSTFSPLPVFCRATSSPRTVHPWRNVGHSFMLLVCNGSLPLRWNWAFVLNLGGTASMQVAISYLISAAAFPAPTIALRNTRGKYSVFFAARLPFPVCIRRNDCTSVGLHPSYLCICPDLNVTTFFPSAILSWEPLSLSAWPINTEIRRNIVSTIS